MKRVLKCDLCGSEKDVSFFAFRLLCAGCRRGTFWGVSLRKAGARARTGLSGEGGMESYFLVACEPHPRPAGSKPIEMWASRVGRDGLRLTWTLPWVCNSCSYRLWWRPGYECRVETCPFVPQDAWLGKGRRVTIHNLAHDDHGSTPVQGTVIWKKQDADGQRSEVGVRCATKNGRSVTDYLFRATALPSSVRRLT